MISGLNIKKKIFENYNYLYKSFLPEKKNNFDFKKIKKYKKYKNIVIIGMGGSILGSKAIYSFLKYKIKKNFIFLDNLDQNLIKNIKKEKNLTKTLFIIISKSGNTTETIINLSNFNSFLKKDNVIIISENKNNILLNFAKKKNFTFIKHNHYIGGRYSVLSEVGMIPAYLMGLSPLRFKKKLSKYLNNKKKLQETFNHAKKINKERPKALILLNYIPELNDFLFWCQQLLAESLGKNKKGFIPIISNAPKDHHSLLQLYLDGPKDKFFYVFSFEGARDPKLNCNMFEKKISYLNKTTYEKLKLFQKKAFLTILKKNKTPFREIKIKKFDEETLGQLFLIFIFETITLGKIMKINPFDQPAVEQVKILTKKFLT